MTKLQNPPKVAYGNFCCVAPVAANLQNYPRQRHSWHGGLNSFELDCKRWKNKTLTPEVHRSHFLTWCTRPCTRKNPAVSLLFNRRALVCRTESSPLDAKLLFVGENCCRSVCLSAIGVVFANAVHESPQGSGSQVLRERERTSLSPGRDGKKKGKMARSPLGAGDRRGLSQNRDGP